MFEQVCILAPGLLGASLGMAVAERGLARRVVVWARRAEARVECEQQDWCTSAFATPEEAVRGSDLVVLCSPVDTIHRLARRIAGSLEKNALVTDVGSTKSLICRFCDAFMPDTAAFIGSHPMAGSEKSGMSHALGDLFEGRSCFVTPLVDSPESEVEKLVRFWKELGMEVGTVSPEVHDEIVANVSHLPHVLASVLCAYLADQRPEWRNYAGAGLADTTRIAGGSAPLWRGILEQNRDEVLRAIDGLDNTLQRFKSALANEQYGEVLNFLERGRVYRQALRPGEESK